jgi:hypothetical protein
MGAKPHEPPDLNARLRKLRDKYAPWQKVLPYCNWVFPQRLTKNEIIYGVYCSDQNLIYVNLILAAKWVPPEFLDYILWHELCHAFQDEFPIKGEADHSPRFRKWETMFRYTVHGQLWEMANHGRLTKEQNRLVHQRGKIQVLPHPKKLPPQLRD